MDRKTIVALVTAIVLMIGAGVGLLVLLRELDPGRSWEPPEDLAGAYVEEVEERCSRRYTRPVPGGGSGAPGPSAELYVKAMELLPELSESEWAQIMDEMIVDSWNGGSPPLPPAVEELGPAASSVIEGAGRADGRSPYAFCAVDADVEVLMRYKRLARALELVARSRVKAGDEKAAARLLSSIVTMEMDLGRGSGIVGHMLGLSMVRETLTHAIVPYAEVAGDPDALRDLAADLARLEASWVDLADSVRLDGLVQETMYAVCFMPPGWDPPVGPPVLTPEESESICALGRETAGTIWQATRERSLELVEALELPTPPERYDALLAIETRTDQTPMWRKLLRPAEIFTDLGAPATTPRLLDDLQERTLLMLARTMLSFRLLALEAGSLPSTMDETSWSGLYDGGRPIREPWNDARPAYSLEGETVVLRSNAYVEGWSPPALAADVAAHLDAP